jgi:DNA repair ATPase RecN
VTTASARSVDGADRVDEIARMLSGEQAGESARVHAADLLAARLRLS